MILLDTCVLFWLECNPARIPTPVKDVFQGTDSIVHASAISAFELGLKIRNKQLELPLPASEWVQEVCNRRGIHLLPINTDVAGHSTLLPLSHKDPCDRFLIATAISSDLTMVTPDTTIHQYPNLKVLW